MMMLRQSVMEDLEVRQNNENERNGWGDSSSVFLCIIWQDWDILYPMKARNDLPKFRN